MKKFRLNLHNSYTNFEDTVIVEAKNEEEAEEKYYVGDFKGNKKEYEGTDIVSMKEIK